MPKLGGIYVSVRAKTDKYKRDLAEAKTLTKKAVVMLQHQINSISWKQVAAGALAFGAVIGKMAFDGFRAMEKMKLSTASLASTITSFAKDADKDLAGTYEQALGYSEQLVFKMEELNAKTVATGENLTAMVETMAQGGVLLDLNNKEQIKGFLAIANALALVTQGQNQDIQFRQEIRGLINGEVKATNALSRILSQKVGGNLKEHVKLWKEQGTLIESAGALLNGFQEGAKDLENTWEAVGTTLSTMYSKTLRGLMAPVYEDIIRMGKQITLNVLDQNSALNRNATFLKTVVFKGWQDIKNITESVFNIIAAFETPLLFIGKITGLILDGWGQILAIFPAITKSFKLITQAVFDSVKMIGHFGAALWKAMSLDFEGAAKSITMAKEDWIESGKKTGEAFGSGFIEELEKNLAEYNKDLSTKIKPPVTPPELKPPIVTPPKITKAEEEYAKLIDKLFQPIGKDEWERDQEFFEKMIADQIKMEEERLETRKSFDEEYAKLGKTRFEVERDQLARTAELWKEAGIEKERIDKMVSAKSIEIAQAEQMAKLDIYQSAAGGIADTFQAIAQAGGKQSKKAFLAYKAFAMAEATIAGHQAILKALAAAPPPYNFVLAGIAGAATAVQIGMIASAQPPSYDTGGVSNAKGVYQTGPIKEAHVPIPSGKIPVELNDNRSEEKPLDLTIVNVTDPSQIDQWAMSSRGRNTIFNSLNSEPRKLKQLLRSS